MRIGEVISCEWHRAVIKQRDEGREGTVEGIHFAALEQYMFKKN